VRTPAPRGGRPDRTADTHRPAVRVPRRYDPEAVAELAVRLEAAASLLAYALTDQANLADAAYGALGHIVHGQLLLRAAA
jgi:hypothetical protein